MAGKNFSKKTTFTFFMKIEVMTGSVGHGALLQLSYPGAKAENSTGLRC